MSGFDAVHKTVMTPSTTPYKPHTVAPAAIAVAKDRRVNASSDRSIARLRAQREHRPNLRPELVSARCRRKTQRVRGTTTGLPEDTPTTSFPAVPFPATFD